MKEKKRDFQIIYKRKETWKKRRKMEDGTGKNFSNYLKMKIKTWKKKEKKKRYEARETKETFKLSENKNNPLEIKRDERRKTREIFKVSGWLYFYNCI